MPLKSGFVVLVGRSNVGKSTLLNTLVGTKIAATSFRAQMTRHPIQGVMNVPPYDEQNPGGQAVFIDTPGIFKDKRNQLSAKVSNTARQAIEGVDLIIYVVDPTREIGDEERAVYGMIRHAKVPKILVINKSDLDIKERAHQDSYEAWGADFDSVFNLSALQNRHVQPLKERVMALLPKGEIMYPDEQLTNMPKEFFIAELIREKTFSVLDKEVPYTITVEVDDIEEKPEITVIKARVLTEASRYKKMIIGKGGTKIKEIGKMARKELEQATNQKIFLELEVEVDTHWVERL